ncbi:hypothetical protein [Staphylococcus felis]|uniref:hypothetical protein n=1 Tax=Staphylococcus felis TaxID=46127 RepID=UPI000E236C89|nr:hypothetical protein [Staphylococcus felis]REH77760.1 hypothetical protein DOS60_05240 [Staphylococcus felis]REI26496.1 hypothetical protein DOS80_10935 [Staphylococcus felis]
MTLGSTPAFAETFGNSKSGASSVESFQIKYNGASWNYKGSDYKSTSFKYSRNGRTLLTKTAYNGKVTGSVWNDLRWGENIKQSSLGGVDNQIINKAGFVVNQIQLYLEL